VKRIAIGGLGNVLLGDDGVGPVVARLLDARYDFGEQVEVADLGTPALDLIDYIFACDALILVDSVQSGEPAGTVTLYRRDDILQYVPDLRIDPHSPALGESLLTAELMGSAPDEVLLVGICGQSFEPGSSLSPPVRQALDLVMQHVVEELERLGVAVRQKLHAGDPGIWWQPISSDQPLSEK
jgi:hydrogenase maturation protease